MIFFVSFLLAIFPLFDCSSALAAQQLELKYFDLRGAAETARIILAVAGADYKDTRYKIEPGTFNAPEFTAEKESELLNANLGRVPLLIVDGEGLIGQSKSIERFLARKFDLMGNNEVEAAQIDCISEHCRDVKDAAMRKGFSMFTKDKTDEEKAAARKEWFEDEMPAMLKKIEKAVELSSGEKGYAVGMATSYADIALFSLLKDCTLQSDQKDTLKAAEECVSLLAISDRIANDEGVSKWINERPVTNF
eukprot:CAMPEP_0113309342 /NCGR_PEP_ID=MMETSP0010_2-20120614/7429_1 /TAXON_ID=216773 ORGANISM="Corethron hystrix, Strain 308" /NCGR_SAMPLE_ID=MMETSP0010_2 /ASSEMBLY_ACC=CAM_ASM_000155 /LENGTH=249 /DNA_ID=CAMNT_0000164585 /DNA_START=38 /DNA_END=787 /DNA_ORIENTATION=- /assembly_acc=CAM_ASM_000155